MNGIGNSLFKMGAPLGLLVAALLAVAFLFIIFYDAFRQRRRNNGPPRPGVKKGVGEAKRPGFLSRASSRKATGHGRRH